MSDKLQGDCPDARWQDLLERERAHNDEIMRLTSALSFSEQAYADMQSDRDWWKRRCEELRAECDRYAAIMGQRITRDVSFDGVTIKKGCAVSTLIIAATRTLDMGSGDLDEQ